MAQKQLDRCYIKVAEAHAELSHGVRAKVGACLVTQAGVIIPGVNGLPKALGNTLEYTPWLSLDFHGNPFPGQEELVTKDEVIHAELNCILKAAKEGVSVKNAQVYVTLSPCVRCASMLLSCDIHRLVYLEAYRNPQGLELLKNAGVIVQSFEETQT